jgi:ribonuclease HI
MSFVYIHADESCLGNARNRATPGGAAGMVEVWRDGAWERRDYWISESATTNNRMAIRSAITPFDALRKPCDIIFVSDSQYLVLGMKEWVHGWVRRGWKRKTGPVENEDLWRDLLKAAAPHRVDWRWVRGHAGHPRNEYANDLAVAAAKSLTTSDGLQTSGFTEWLDAQRERGRYVDFMEFTPPPEETFRPVSPPTGRSSG